MYFDEVIFAAALEAIAHSDTTCFSEAVMMWCMECIWISYCMRFLDAAPVCIGGLVFFAYRFCFSFESMGWLHGCWTGSGSGRPCLHAFIAVPRSGAWSESHPWISNLTCAVCGGSHGPRTR